MNARIKTYFKKRSQYLLPYMEKLRDLVTKGEQFDFDYSLLNEYDHKVIDIIMDMMIRTKERQLEDIEKLERDLCTLGQDESAKPSQLLTNEMGDSAKFVGSLKSIMHTSSQGTSQQGEQTIQKESQAFVESITENTIPRLQSLENGCGSKQGG